MPRHVQPGPVDGAAGASSHHLSHRMMSSAKAATSQPESPTRRGFGRSTKFGERDLSRSRTDGEMREGVHCGRAKVSETQNKVRHLDEGMTPTTGYERRPNRPKFSDPTAAEKKHASLCPWQPDQHPERQVVMHKLPASLPEKTVRERSKGAGLAPSWPGNQAASGPVPNRFPVDARGREQAVLMARRRQFHDQQKDTLERSRSADDVRSGRRFIEQPGSPTRLFRPGGRQTSGTPQMTTSLHGPPTVPTPARMRSVSPDRFRFEAPYAAEGGAAVRSRSAEPRGRRPPPTRADASAPFDASWDHTAVAARDAPGSKRQFRPTTRVFSQENTHEKIWGAQ